MRRLWMRCIAAALLLVVVVLPFPGAAHSAWNIRVLAVGEVKPATRRAVENAALLTARWLVKNGVKLPYETPRIVKVYAARELFARMLVREGSVSRANGETSDAPALERARRFAAEVYGIVLGGNTAHVIVENKADAELVGGVVHELTHVFQNEKSGCPGQNLWHFWLQEGSAELIAYHVSERDSRGATTDLSYWLKQYETPKLSEIVTDGQVWEDPDRSPERIAAAYGTSLLATHFLVGNAKQPIRSLFYYFSLCGQTPEARDENFLKAFGISHQNFEKVFEKWLDSYRK